jgi:hypothetical protein
LKLVLFDLSLGQFLFDVLLLLLVSLFVALYFVKDFHSAGIFSPLLVQLAMEVFFLGTQFGGFDISL